jgi:hypothetical protein
VREDSGTDADPMTTVTRLAGGFVPVVGWHGHGMD